MTRKKKITIKEAFKEELIPRINKLLYSRRVLLAPFPVEPMDIYSLVWSEEEHKAIRVIRGREGALNTRNHVFVGQVPQESIVPFKIRVMLRENMPVPWDNYVDFARLRPSAQKDILQWVPLWKGFTEENEQLIWKVEQLAAKCATYGQAVRIWPDLLSLYPEEARARLEIARAASRYPDEVRLFDGSHTLREEFRPEAYAPFTAILAEALLLPHTESKSIATLER